jgi:hypothetical protein
MKPCIKEHNDEKLCRNRFEIFTEKLSEKSNIKMVKQGGGGGSM